VGIYIASVLTGLIREGLKEQIGIVNSQGGIKSLPLPCMRVSGRSSDFPSRDSLRLRSSGEWNSWGYNAARGAHTETASS
jgi:hypothetical protein